MEFKTNNKRSQPNSSGTSHFTESNAGHITVKTTSPFLNRVKESDYCVTDQNNNKGKKNLSAIVLNKKLPRDIASGTSKMLINQILGDSNIDRDAILNLNKPTPDMSLNQIEQCNYNQNFLINQVQFRNSTPTFNSKSFSMQHGSCSREESIIQSKSSMNEENYYFHTSNATSSHKKYAEKTTYCRPIRNHNMENINKTVEQNNRLQRLVRKLIDVRKKERQTEAWNNYINELKNKHGYGDSDRNGVIAQYSLEEPTQMEYIDDYYNTQTKSAPCKELLHEFYEAYNTVQYDYPYKYIDYRNQRPPHQNYRSHLNNSSCYPMSSQGRLMMLNREKAKNAAYGNDTYCPNRPFRGNTIYVEKEPRKDCPAQVRRKCRCNILPDPERSSKSVQTDIKCSVCLPPPPPPPLNCNGKCVRITEEKNEESDCIKDIYSRVSANVDRLKKKIQDTRSFDTCNLQHTVLQSIESKIDTLLCSLNMFMEEVKSKTYSSPSGQNPQCEKGAECEAEENCCFDYHPVYVQPVRDVMGMSGSSDTNEIIEDENVTSGLPTRTNRHSALFSGRKKIICSRATNIENFLIEQINGSGSINDEIESMLTGKPGNCSLQISIEIPTKERSTEVTDSLSRAVLRLDDEYDETVSIEKLTRGTSDRENMTIAVNTDPLGLLALLRVSTETVKQLFSYMPNINYYNYLPMLNFPQRNEVTHYVCNICGAAFGRPSQLSDHIRSHDLGRTRDCCVCRHVLDMQRHRQPGLFRCRYCGKHFTRAYCCELHQESCARRLGITHDVTTSQILLR